MLATSGSHLIFFMNMMQEPEADLPYCTGALPSDGKIFT